MLIVNEVEDNLIRGKQLDDYLGWLDTKLRGDLPPEERFFLMAAYTLASEQKKKLDRKEGE